MKKIKMLCFALLASCVFANVSHAYNPYAAPATVHVNGYTRSDGTYVRGHVRTAPDGIKSNNLSY